MGAKKRMPEKEIAVTEEELAKMKGAELSFIRHARYKLGLKYHREDKIKIFPSDWDEFIAKRQVQNFK